MLNTLLEFKRVICMTKTHFIFKNVLMIYVGTYGNHL